MVPCHSCSLSARNLKADCFECHRRSRQGIAAGSQFYAIYQCLASCFQFCPSIRTDIYSFGNGFVRLESGIKPARSFIIGTGGECQQGEQPAGCHLPPGIPPCLRQQAYRAVGKGESRQKPPLIVFALGKQNHHPRRKDCGREMQDERRTH